MTRLLCVTVSLGLSTALYAGTIVKSKYTADGKESQMTVYSSPGKQRVDLGDSRTIQQCDGKGMVQFDDKTKTFIVVPEAAKPNAPADPAAVCQNKPVSVDTGEKKRILGLDSTRWKTTLEGCDGSKTEIDGYYTGFEYAVSCGLAPVIPIGPPGSPLAYTVVTSTADGKSSSVSYVVESLQLTSGPLESALFEVPGEAKETTIVAAQAIRNPDFIEAAGNPKLPGSARIGVAMAGGKGAVDTALVRMLKDAKVDAVPLGAGPDEEIQSRAQQTMSDYVLMLEVGEIKPGGTNKVGGFLSKASSLASGSAERQAYNATVNFTLTPLAGGPPKLVSSATGATAQFGLKEAIALGRVATMFTPVGMMFRPGMGGMMPFLMQMGGPGMMGAGSGFGGGGLQSLMRTVDPGIMMMQPAVAASMVAAGSPGGESQEKAVSAALERVAKSVAVAIQPASAQAAPAKGKPAKGKKK